MNKDIKSSFSVDATALSDQNPLLLFSLNEQGQIITENSKGHYRHFTDLFESEFRQKIHDGLILAQSTLKPSRQTVWIRGSENKNRPAQLNICPLTDKSQNFTGYFCLIEDRATLDEFYESVKKEQEGLSLASSIIRSVLDSIDVDNILEGALKKTIKHSGYESGGIFILNEKTDKLYLRAHSGIPDKLLKKWRQLDASDDLPGHTLREKHVIFCLKDGVELDSVLCRKAGMTSFFGVPLFSSRSPMGVLFLASKTINAVPDHTFINLLSFIGFQIGMALQNALLFEQTVRKSVEISTLSSIGKELSTKISSVQLYPAIIEQLNILIPFTTGALLLNEGNHKTPTLAASKGLDSSNNSKIYDIFVNLHKTVTNTLQPILVPDSRKSQQHFKKTDSVSPHSLVSVPLVYCSKSIGSISIAHFSPKSFDAETLKLFRSFSNYASISIANAFLYQEISSARDTLALSENRLKTLIENADDIIFTLDLDGNILFLNRKFEEGGARINDFLGKTFISMVHENSHNKAKDFFKTVLAGENYRSDLQFKSHFGTKTYSISANPLKNSDGKIIGAQGIARDMSKEKNADSILSQQSRLEGMRDHVSNMLSDFHSLLRQVHEYAKQIRNGLMEDDALTEYARNIINMTQEASSTIEKHFFTDHSIKKHKPVRINEILKETVSSFIKEGTGSMTNLSMKLFEPLPSVLGEEDQLREIFYATCAATEYISQKNSELRIYSRIENLDEMKCREISEAVPGKYILVKILHKKLDVQKDQTITGIEKMDLSRICWILQNHKGYIDISNRFEKWFQIKIFIPVGFCHED
ncbi:MAG: PAS domain S-box protein [Candidatus Theseobacter exili]|nr:PAS domain S-box protein [Candidatus Theseobacter exili]